MTEPASPQHGVAFDLDSLEKELRREYSYLREGHAARTLARTDDLRVVLVVLASGKRMSEHQTDVTTSIHTVSGHVRLRLPDRDVDVRAGNLLMLGRDLKHDVEAVSDSALLLTLGWHEHA
jgi:quercetin dioxygenase-like cupin family protein